MIVYGNERNEFYGPLLYEIFSMGIMRCIGLLYLELFTKTAYSLRKDIWFALLREVVFIGGGNA